MSSDVDGTLPDLESDATGGETSSVSFLIYDSENERLGHTAVIDHYENAFSGGVNDDTLVSSLGVSLAGGVYENFALPTTDLTLTGEWTRTDIDSYDGNYSLESPNKTDSTESSGYITFPQGAISFWYKVSSETGYDKLYIYLNDVAIVDGVSGDGEWTQVETNGELVSNVLEFKYKKDSSSSKNQDAAFIDAVSYGSYNSSGTYRSAPVSIAGKDDLKIKWEETVLAGTSLTVSTGTSDSESVEPAAWYEQTSGALITDLPADLTGKYLWYKVELATPFSGVAPSLNRLVVYENTSSPRNIVHVTFNGETKAASDSGYVTFTNAMVGETLSYVADLFSLEEATNYTSSEVGGSVAVSSSGSLGIIVFDIFRMSVDADLPTVSCEGSFGTRATLDADLPGITLAAYSGASLDADLPAIEIEATCQAAYTATLNKRLPTISCAARMGNRADDLKLPAISIVVEMSTPTLMTLNKRLPTPSLSATISGASGSLDKVLTFPKIAATGSMAVTGDLDAKIPTLKISAKALSGATGSVDATLPDMRVEAESKSVVISLDAYLPCVTSGVASGSGYGGAGSTISGDRFDDTLLRYERWA